MAPRRFTLTEPGFGKLHNRLVAPYWLLLQVALAAPLHSPTTLHTRPANCVEAEHDSLPS
jgi:hypothetical protein